MPSDTSMPRPIGARPPAEVLRAFGLGGVPRPLPGGQGTSWHVGDSVVKPSDVTSDVIQWRADLMQRLAGWPGLRVSAPLRALDGAWTAAGWQATQYQPGSHASRRWPEIIAAGELFHAALADEAKPAFFAGRTDRWSIGDRVAWGELPWTDYRSTRHLAELVAALRPVPDPCQLIHGDLTGNVLFHDELPPLIIDLSPYWRPAAFGTAIVVADALVFEGAGEDLLQPLLASEHFPQYLLRALIYRAITDWLADGDTARPDSYLAAVRLVLRLT